MSDRRPSGLAPTRIGVRGIPYEVDVDAELDVHRRVVLAGLAIGLAIGGTSDATVNVALYTWPFALMLAISGSVSWWMRRRSGSDRT